MKLTVILLVVALFFTPAVHAMEFTAPEVPESGRIYLDQEPETFSEGLLKIVSHALEHLQPALVEAGRTCVRLLAAVILLSVTQSMLGEKVKAVELAGVAVIATLLFAPSESLIQLGNDTVKEISDYGKLLLPVMSGVLAAQGGVTASAALYTGTAFFNALLSSIISNLIVPLIYAYLVLCIACQATGESGLEKLKDFVKWLMTWMLKTVLYIFTGYLGVTGVVSGSVDAAAMKATKLTISGMVPVVGGILSDASETVLVSAQIMKNSAGVYGILAMIAIWIGPFLKIGAQYLMLKLTYAVCGIFGGKEGVKLIGDFSGTMGLLLGMTGAVCLLLLVSTVCLMRSVGV